MRLNPAFFSALVAMVACQSNSSIKVEETNNAFVESAKLDEYRKQGIVNKGKPKQNNQSQSPDVVSVHNPQPFKQNRIVGYCQPKFQSLNLRRVPSGNAPSVKIRTRGQKLTYHGKEGVWLQVFQSYYVLNSECTPILAP